jgi:hypothetical protein
MGDTKPIGVAYRDQDLEGSLLTSVKTAGLTGYLYGHNSSSALTASLSIPYSDISGGPALFKYGAFSYVDGPQTAAAATVAILDLNTTDLSNGVSLGSPTSKIVVNTTGVYTIIISIQVSNPSAQVDDFTLWVRKNGTDIPNSASVVGTPAKHGAINGHTILAVNFVLSLMANDYLQFCWTTGDGSTSVITYPASLSPPIHPAAPGVILTFVQIF